MALNAKQVGEARVLWDKGETAGNIGKVFGVTKSVIVGIAYRNGWPKRPNGWFVASPAPPPIPRVPLADRAVENGLFARMDALHATLDRILAETKGIGRIPDSGRRSPPAA